MVEARQEVTRLYYEFLLDRPETEVDSRAGEVLVREAEHTHDLERLAMIKRALRELFRPQRQAYP